MSLSACRIAAAATLFLTIAAASSCTPAAKGELDAAAAGAIDNDRQPRELMDAAADADGIVRVLVYHDMEGLSGQDDWRTFTYRHREPYARGQEMLVADVNAVIDGLFAGGADEVHVVDAHGSGNPGPDILRERLDRRAEQIIRDEPFRQYVDLVEPNSYDAVAVVGMHSKTGSGGFAAHTYTLGMEIIMNGQSLTETELIGYSWGRVAVPVIFASGDDRLRDDLRTMPWIEYVTVKDATSASTVELRPVDEVRRELRNRARRAVENRANARAMRLATPIVTTLHALPPANLSAAEALPGIKYEDQRATFVAEDFQAAYDGVIGLVGVATSGYSRVLRETVAAHPDGERILARFGDSLVERWLDYESGRWHPEPGSAAPADRRYHGAR